MPDGGTMINDALFGLNGGCGYVLKPEHLIRSMVDVVRENCCCPPP